MGRKVNDLKKQLLADTEFRKEYEALEEEFSVASTLIEARRNAGLSQEQVAAIMGTTQSAVARIESGRPLPSIRTLMRYAAAVGRKLEIRLQKAA